jgi:hypothetical protein
MEPRHLTSRTNGNGEFSEQAVLLPAAVGAEGNKVRGTLVLTRPKRSVDPKRERVEKQYIILRLPNIEKSMET